MLNLKIEKKELLTIRNKYGAMFRVLINPKYIKEIEKDVEEVEKEWLAIKDEQGIDGLEYLIEEKVLRNPKYKIKFLIENNIMVDW